MIGSEENGTWDPGIFDGAGRSVSKMNYWSKVANALIIVLFLKGCFVISWNI